MPLVVVVLVLVAGAGALLWARRPGESLPVAPPIAALSRDELFVKFGTKWGINPAWLKAIARQESDLGAYRVGPEKVNQSLGLMQINPVNFWRRPGQTPDDWETDDALSIDVAGEILADYRRKFGWTDPDHLLAAYNWGPENVKALGARFPDGLPHSTARYVAAIKGFADGYLNDFASYNNVSKGIVI